MNRIARLIGLSAVLLTIFLVAVLASGLRLRAQSERIRQETIQSSRQQLEQFLALTKPGRGPWPPEFVRSLGALLNARVTVSPANDNAEPEDLTPADTHAWAFDHVLRADGGAALARVGVVLTPPPAVRLLKLYQHTALALLFLALGLTLALVLMLLFDKARAAARGGPSAGAGDKERGDFGSLSQLAKVSVQQGVDLAHERNERLRAEEDSLFRQVLLNRALEERIQLGRELHDGVIQSLYATGLTLEAAKNQIATAPAAATAQLAGGLKALNTTIREVRSYISGLSPERIQQQSFGDALRSLTQSLVADRATTFDLRIDDSAASLLSDEQATNLLQIAREAVSNSLRHGGATHITIRLHGNEGELCLLVQDDGRGFDRAKAASTGHGLGNIAARADRIHAQLDTDTAPGKGTRIVLTFPSAPPST